MTEEDLINVVLIRFTLEQLAEQIRVWEAQPQLGVTLSFGGEVVFVRREGMLAAAKLFLAPLVTGEGI